MFDQEGLAVGFLRLFLAISVVVAHAGPLMGYTFIGGVASVQIFFIISGFYMTLVLNKKYVGVRSNYLFFSNRFLRLFPIYIIVLLLSLLASLLSGTLFGKWVFLKAYVNYFDVINGYTFLYLIATNILIFGQDVVMFMGFDPLTGAMFFTENFKNSIPQMHSFLIIPQAWSIGVELLFYLVAPFLLRKKLRYILIFLIASLFLRGVIYYCLDWMNDPWLYRFFPTELALFLLGSISFHFYEYLTNNQKWIGLQNYFIFSYLLLILSYPLISTETIDLIQIKNWTLYICTVVVIPYLFTATKSSKIDNFIGELSYPVYLIHVLMIFMLRALKLEASLVPFAVVLSVIGGIVLVKYIDMPIEKYRQSRVSAIK
ncbi:acyltransferase [Sulfurimonas sp. HSL-1656]|uniref:acyltransferase family protein n=1 Tax=Thiomicrolovo subterrani TaxID=3131934 RepID=UPI0031F75AAE